MRLGDCYAGRRPTASKRVSSPPVGTIPSASDVTDEPNPNSKPHSSSLTRSSQPRDGTGYLAPLLRISRAPDICEILVLFVGEAIFEPANKRLERVREREGCVSRAESGQLLAGCLSALRLRRIALDVLAAGG